MNKTNFLNVSNVKSQDDFKLIIYYGNGEARLFDMTKSWLWEKKSYQILHNSEEFKKVKPFLDTVQWDFGDYTLEIAPEELYEESVSIY